MAVTVKVADAADLPPDPPHRRGYRGKLTGRRMRVLVAALAVALCVAGCMARGERVQGQQVNLATTRLPVGESGCYATGREVLLVADGTSGTGVKDGPEDPDPDPLYWPAGYTAWRVGAEIEVRDLVGNFVAVTGRRYMVFLGAYPVGSSPEGLVTSRACINERADPTPMGLLVLFIIGIALASALLLVRRVGGKDREATLRT